MAQFIGSSRDQVQRILDFAAVSGRVALVGVASGRVELSAGAPIDPMACVVAARAGCRADARLAAFENARVTEVGPGFLVGPLGTTHAVVLELDASGAATSATVAHFEKACWLLARMLRAGHNVAPPAMPPPDDNDSGPSGAPAELRLWPPHRRPSRGQC